MSLDTVERKETQENTQSKNYLNTSTTIAPITLALTACGGGSDDNQTNASNITTETTNTNSAAGAGNEKIIIPSNKLNAARFLQKASFSSTNNEITALMGKSYNQWLTEQFELPVEQTGWDWLINNNFVTDKFQFSFYPACYAMWKQLFTDKDVLRKRIALALSEIFVISLRAVNTRHKSFTQIAYWDLLNKHAFGNFRELLEEVTLSPAMGLFLSTHNNKKANKKTGRAPDENYAREVLQLFSIGLYQLNIDGSIKHDSNSKAINSYSENDIINLARVFTGWSFKIEETPLSSNSLRDRMKLNEHDHSLKESNFLGIHIPANTGGYDSLRIALDGIFNHPNVGPFIAKQLIQRLVISNPSPEYIKAVALIFNDNGESIRGDLKAVIKTILLHPEAHQENMGKLREPMLRFIQWGRTFKANSYSGRFEIAGLESSSYQLNQSPLMAPSVFNFFRPGFIPPNTVFSQQKMVAPEFQITDEVSVAGYINFMGRVLSKGYGKKYNGRYDVQGNYENYISLADKPQKLVEKLNLELCANALSNTSISLIVTGISDIKTSRTDWKKLRTITAIHMIMSCAEYIVQK